ncbi:MAG TPA: cellulose binding domain-containing protein [Actinocrinis sp.]|uniref:glucuronyl esterase domain-containing protein n=1 Tax=Actinocrinis sp. TaxID=1920516 RepID=UPI002DDD1B8E|nr:cellulose binding domain-containing protein [Actinocrinis sp.]HEV2344583.1 cellulose binding domain-containing protein [Actinocrinis sp.]
MIRSSIPKLRSAVVMAVVAALMAAGAETVTARTATATIAASPAALTSTVEDDGAGCAVTLPGSLTSNSLLPDPFTKLNGSRITSTSDWTCRREEILQLSEKYVYGQKAGKPASVTGTVSSTNITVNVSDSGKSGSFSAGVTLPSGTGPFPAVIVYGGVGVDTATILSSGAAVINYNPLNVGAEGTARNAKSGVYYTLYGSTSTTGLLMAWAWGVSRIIDVINQSGGNILANSVGVTGCSRYGKGAFVAGAFDQRIALTMPVESGTDGVPIFRGIPGESGAQPLGEAYNEQPWVGDAFSAFTSDPTTLPIDTDEVVGMIAPRGAFIMENPHIDWLAAKSGSVSALGGREIYTALGAGPNISYWSDVADGTHCAVRPEWTAPLQQSIQKFLKGTGTAPGVFRISSLKAGDLSQWRNWTTPTLSQSSSSPTPSTSPSASPSSSPSPSASPSPSNSPSSSPSSSPSASPSPSSSPSNPPPGGCTAVPALNQWAGGFTVSVNVTAGASAISSWTVTINLPSSAVVTSTWNATASGAGTMHFANVSYDGSVGAGQTTNFGFQGTGTATGMTVVSCSAT